MRSMPIMNWSMLDKRQERSTSVLISTDNLTFKDDGICFPGLEPDMSPNRTIYLPKVLPFRNNKKLMFLRC